MVLFSCSEKIRAWLQHQDFCRLDQWRAVFACRSSGFARKLRPADFLTFAPIVRSCLTPMRLNVF